MKAVLLLMFALASTGCLSYNKAMVKCERKCLPNTVKAIDYNYSTNRYDVCVCNLKNEVKPLTEEEYSN